MKLGKLLSTIPDSLLGRVDFGADPEILRLAYDSRQVAEGSLFFAIRGFQTDGHRFVPEALARGASAIASEFPEPPDCPVPWIQTPAIRRFMACCADHWFGQPSRKIRLAGITGTNGKTTTAYLVHAAAGVEAPCLMVGTVETLIGAETQESSLTTPESVDIQALLQRAFGQGCPHGVMEASSHALALDRLFGCRIPVAVFTNLTQDHLDFHPDLEDYFEAKARLFDPEYNPSLEFAAINGDDPWGCRLLERVPGAISYGMGTRCEVRPLRVESGPEGIRLELAWFGNRLELESPLVGRHNVFNLMAAATAAHGLGLAPEAIQAGLARLRVVPGRFERVDLRLPFSVFIDYAHTPDALENVLKLAREVTAARLICLFGCGGDRDRAKRPKMGEIAARLADLVIVTSDNPRTEDPEAIIADIAEGLPADRSRIVTLPDRRAAIRRSLEMARPGDLILLAGKGHETYQVLGRDKVPFDERVIVKEAACSL